ncbi:MAG TPA: AbrB/MazE/SpoVT family DNA-binding domain-containing protein [Caldilineaceae bacterium]|nr:AbrB/MazE/SpoVT family DNA-binding domain-containing protein [Caldilineaceae bacterium]
MSNQEHGVEVQVGPQGQVVIPIDLRRAWQIESGQILIARLEGDRLV